MKSQRRQAWDTKDARMDRRYKRLAPEKCGVWAPTRRTVENLSVASSRPSVSTAPPTCSSARTASAHPDGAGPQYLLLKNTRL